MNLSRKWLQEFVDLSDIGDRAFSEAMSISGSKVEASVWPMPTYWAPWPGKSKIVLDIIYIPLRIDRNFCLPQI